MRSPIGPRRHDRRQARRDLDYWIDAESEIPFWFNFTVWFFLIQNFFWSLCFFLLFCCCCLNRLTLCRWTWSSLSLSNLAVTFAAATPDKMGRLYAHVWCVAWSSFPLARRPGMAVESGWRFGSRSCRFCVHLLGLTRCPGFQVIKSHTNSSSHRSSSYQLKFGSEQKQRKFSDSEMREKRDFSNFSGRNISGHQFHVSPDSSRQGINAVSPSFMLWKTFRAHTMWAYASLCTYICRQIMSKWFRELISLLRINMRTSWFFMRDFSWKRTQTRTSDASRHLLALLQQLSENRNGTHTTYTKTSTEHVWLGDWARSSRD